MKVALSSSETSVLTRAIWRNMLEDTILQNKKEINRTVRSSSRAGRVLAQRRQFDLEFRSLASLAVWLDQEDLVQLAERRSQVMMRKLIAVNYLGC
jgi:hypothetical protein